MCSVWLALSPLNTKKLHNRYFLIKQIIDYKRYLHKSAFVICCNTDQCVGTFATICFFQIIIFYYSIAQLYMLLSTCRQKSAKCPNVKDSQKIVLFCNILSKTDTKFAHQTCVSWRTKDRPTLMKVSEFPKNLSKIYFHSSVKNKN